MSISLVAKPYAFSPAYNELKFQYLSTNVNAQGFRYIFDIYLSGTSTKIAELKPLPRFGDGVGEVDLSPILKSLVSFDFDPTLTGSANASNSWYKYDVKVGEEFVSPIAYTASVTNNGGYVKITTTHAFVVGDQVVIDQADDGAVNPNLQGLFTVIAITGTTDFTVNSLFSQVTDVTINGSVTYSDNRKTITRDIITSLNNYVFNGTFDFVPWISFVDTDYLLNSSTDKLLTGWPTSGMYAAPSQDVWFNIGNNSVTTGYMYFQNSNGDILRKTITNANIITQVGVGPNNSGTLSVVSGTNPLVKDDTTYYDVWYANSAGTQHSLKYRVNIDRRCKISEIEIVFLDRLGSFGSFAFQLRSYDKGNVTREMYTKYIQGLVNSSRWTHKTYERGSSVITPKVDPTNELNTNWMTEEMAGYFAELISSPETYIKIGANYVACVVQETSFEIEHEVNKNLIKKSITVKLANTIKING